MSNEAHFVRLSNIYFYELHKLRLSRLDRAGIDISGIPSIDEGGDYVVEEILHKKGLPKIRGKKEKRCLEMGRDCSQAACVHIF